MLRVGIAGCGRIAQTRHLPEYREREDVSIAGLYDINRERAGALAAEYGTRVFDSFDAMLDSPEIDAVSICTANVFHADMTVNALKAGKHVLCEKPMATTLKDCERMVLAARESGKCLMIGQNQRLTAAHRKAKELLSRGAIGRPISFATAFCHSGPENWSVDPGKNTWFFDKNLASMGVMADLGIHKTDLILWLLEDTVADVTARFFTLDKRDRTGRPISVEDNAECILHMKSGIAGTLTASWTHYCGEDNSTVIYGTEGVLRIYTDPVHSLILQRRNGTNEYYDLESIQTNDHQTKSGIIDMFTDHLKDDTLPYISGESVLNAMRAVYAAQRSAAEGKNIAITDA